MFLGDDRDACPINFSEYTYKGYVNLVRASMLSRNNKTTRAKRVLLPKQQIQHG